MQFAPHQILAASQTFTAATTAPTAVQVNCLTGETGPRQFIVTNLGANPVFMGIGASAAAASSAASTTIGGTQPTRIVLALSQITITANAGSFFTGVTTTGTSQVVIEPGEGV